MIKRFLRFYWEKISFLKRVSPRLAFKRIPLIRNRILLLRSGEKTAQIEDDDVFTHRRRRRTTTRRLEDDDDSEDDEKKSSEFYDEK